MNKAHVFRTSAQAGAALVVMLLGTALVAGCAKQGDQGRVISAAEMNKRSQAEALRIQNNPNLSPMAKAMAVQSMQAGERNAQMAQKYMRAAQPGH